MGSFSTKSKEIRDRFSSEYDVDDLAINDQIMLDELSTAMAQLELLNAELDTLLTADEIDLRRVSDVNKVISTTRADISKIQEDLRITRKTRKEKSDSVPEFIRDLKQRASKFLEERMSHLYCPSCKTLVCSVWFLSYEQPNKILLECPKCGHKFIVESQTLNNRTNDLQRLVPYSQSKRSTKEE